MVNQVNSKAFSYAQYGLEDQLKPVMNKLTSVNKVIVFAILKQRDSMYHYLNKDDITDAGAQFPNSRPEIDPYHKEPKYIEFLKKHHIPVDKQKH